MASLPIVPPRIPALFLLVAGVAACSFPDITLAPADTGSTTGGTGGEAGGTATGAAGGGGAGAGAGTAGSGTGAGGGAGGTGGTGGEAGSTSTGTDPCPIDGDGDMAVSWQCPGGTDCADGDVNTHPGIDEPSSIPIQNEKAPGTLDYDKNCNGVEEAETPVLNCVFGNCSSAVKGFASPVACGASAPLGHCQSVAFIGCQWKAENPAQNKTQKCK